MDETLKLSCLAGIATLGGALLGLALPYSWPFSFLAGFAAGVMTQVLAAELLPCLWKGPWITVFLGLGSGALLLLLASQSRLAGTGNSYRRLGWVMFLAVGLHDLPEGIALGAGSLLTQELSLTLALALGLHNLPEGLINAVPLRRGGLSVPCILALNFCLSLFTPLGTLLGRATGTLYPFTVPFSLALASGAMSYVVLAELLPLAASWRGVLGFGAGLGLMEGLSRLIH
ncbi:ZIP family metal transporter [Desulfothermobacter acidiphilus]|uniref:ZIP family metal transporter n=1 Tax=Desulfothermobacter acidiphilus TaxID=1938353 RepID=UPI003F8A922C